MADDLPDQIKRWKRDLVATERESSATVEEMKRLYDELQARSQKLERIDARREALGDLIAGAEKLVSLDQPESAPTDVDRNGAEDGPRGRKAVLQVMQEGGDRLWRPAEIVQAVITKGWVDPEAKNPEASIRVATRRLMRDGEVEKVGSGYRVKRFPGVMLPGLAARASELEIAGSEVDR